jgi:alkylation response protein AidB-like acyl-CoA dehydrogenase
MAIITEELGKASFDVAMCYVANLQMAMVISQWAADEQKAELLPAIIAGDHRLSVSISEPDAGSDVSAISTWAERDDNHFVLNGRKAWCTGAALPNTTLAMYVRTDRHGGRRDGLSLLLVDPATPGLELRKIPTLARHILGTYDVVLSDVRVPVRNLIGPLNEGWKVLTSNLETERVLISAGYVGAAQATLDEAVEYAKERRQFGQPIGNFQALTHALADLQTEVDAARLLVYRASYLADEGRPALREAAMAKLFASETYVKAARWGMQVMAGYGFATESVMSFRYRESIVATISGGTSQIQRNAIARSMGLPVRSQERQK